MQQTGGDPNNRNLESIAWDSTFSNTQASPGGAIGNLMYDSTNGGTTWNHLEAGPSFPNSSGLFSVSATAVPLPGSVWLMTSALLGFAGFNRRKNLQS